MAKKREEGMTKDEANRLSAKVLETADLHQATKVLIDCLQAVE